MDVPLSGGHRPTVQDISFSDFAPRVRKSFASIPRVIDIPNLLEIQRFEDPCWPRCGSGPE